MKEGQCSDHGEPTKHFSDTLLSPLSRDRKRKRVNVEILSTQGFYKNCSTVLSQNQLKIW